MEYYPWGGSEELWSQTALALVDKSFNIAVAQSPKSKGHTKSEYLKRHVNKHYFYAQPKRFSSRYFKKRFLGLDNFSSIIHEIKPKLIVISQGDIQDGIRWLRSVNKMKIPYIVIIQCNADWWYPEDSSLDEVKQFYRNASRVVCVSNHNLQLLRLQIGEDLPQACVIANPFQLKNHGILELRKDKDDVLHLASVARLEPTAKGQDILLRVLDLPKWRERNIRLTFYGDGPYYKSIAGLVKYLDLKNVHFAGHVSSYLDIWPFEDLLVLPSRFEGNSLALLESMWSGRAAVSTRVGSAEEYIIDGLTGFLADSPTIKSFDEALERAWQKRELLKSMGEKARNRLQENLPLSPVVQLAELIINTFDEVVNATN